MLCSSLRSLIYTSSILLGTVAFSHAGDWWNKDWTSRKKITIDTSEKGFAIGNPIGTTAVLIRLKDANFPSGTLDDASDLRFLADDDKTLLSYHIEQWDASIGEAAVWVKLPSLQPEAATKIWLYYGNSKATKSFEPKATYDADTILVYHFAENNAAALDSGPNSILPDASGAVAYGAIIGNGLRLPAPKPIKMDNPAMQWNANGGLTWSLWVKPSALREKAMIFSRQEGDNGFVVGENKGLPYVEITTGGNKQVATGTTSLIVNAWAHLAVIANGPSITLYLNGTAAGTISVGLPALSGPSILGKTDTPGDTSFSGEIDELEISKIAREPGSIKLAAISQGTGPEAAKMITQSVVEAAEEAEKESEFISQVKMFRNIGKDLTFDGKIVIIGCVLLAIVGWMVGVQKFLYLNKISAATKAFLRRWKDISGDLTALDHANEDGKAGLGAASGGEQRLMRQSPLFHIYHIGSQEIQKRIDADKEKFSGLSGRSIEAIRATLDGGHVREVQRLQSKLVFLTIGIAGGPYLGLLGTVIGVMMTFAVIAQSGQVEINSIAPGIAGALLATVAGLAVAIPALFLYSYLNARIKDTINGMEIFIDEFVARIAEAYPTANE